MYAYRLSNYVRIALVAAAAGVMTACAPVRDHAGPPGHHSARVLYQDYWYYPAIGAYYDPRVRIYIYYEHNHWVRARNLPVHLHTYTGRHVIVHSRHERPYEEHRRHRERYAPARYAPEPEKKSPQARRARDLWVGEPRQPNRGRAGDESRSDANEREGSRKDLKRSTEPASAPGRSRRRAPGSTPTEGPAVRRTREGSNGLAEAANRVPGSQDAASARETRKERPEGRTRGAGEYRSNDRQGNDDDRSRPSRRHDSSGRAVGYR